MFFVFADLVCLNETLTSKTEPEKSSSCEVNKRNIKIDSVFIYKPTENFSRQLLFEALTVLKVSLALHFSNFVSSTRVAAAA